MPSLQELAGPVAKPLKLGVTAFSVALCGAAFGFAIDYDPQESLSYVAFGIVAFAVALGFFSIGWAWVAIARQHRARRS